ncbi:ABC transporter substrate-binding protein [Halomonas sp. McH1-25]|uniref:MlaC/ttg2D family ABC transporter substrate-binding protein n=2 Tax=Halomonas TaxID=2745 RepID=UPI001EF5AA89|nr:MULTISPECIES: ABC transporter substrate-binding protein [unclassified Halomonas]MCG7598987.1 ABC transporter substrate-binding protein [Halomonas sp. McH1-25]MCP1342409.1 ABC transporter substrate-binding protein [Halomonas sp. FL8]MCP1367397.1 ABC transporter substrate-binding protein [Halomonas sp. BBD48]
MNEWMAVAKRIPVLLLALCLGLFATQASAQAPEQVIRDSINQLMGQIEGRRDYFAQHPDELKTLVDESLEGVADFRYIGASVMGRYFRNATPEQRSRFAEVFRQTLIDTYAKGLVTFDYRDLRVLEGTGSRYEGQTSVDMEVVATNGQVYPVSYSLRQSDDGQWKVVNVIVNGINLGLTFRNQFDQAMRDNNRDYDKVIGGWAPEVGTEELEQGRGA